jgi:hypothetical protein
MAMILQDNNTPPASPQGTNGEVTYEVSFPSCLDEPIVISYAADIDAIRSRLQEIERAHKLETRAGDRILRYNIVGDPESTMLKDNNALESMRTRLRNGDGQAVMEFDDREEDSHHSIA